VVEVDVAKLKEMVNVTDADIAAADRALEEKRGGEKHGEETKP
jgi:hypothetical protein